MEIRIRSRKKRVKDLEFLGLGRLRAHKCRERRCPVVLEVLAYGHLSGLGV